MIHSWPTLRSGYHKPVLLAHASCGNAKTQQFSIAQRIATRAGVRAPTARYFHELLYDGSSLIVGAEI